MIDSPLYGLRILHYLNPVRYDTTGRFQSEFDSNYKVVEKTISFLPMCHHYIVMPEKHDVLDNRKNVTLLHYPYHRDALSNRSHFYGSRFKRLLDFKTQDIDFVFCHQPEMLYNIFVALNDKRYGQVLNRFLFFHWVDCPQSRASTAIPDSFMRQLEGIDQADNAFFHTEIANDWLKENFKKEKSTSINLDYVKEKTLTFPLASEVLPEPIPVDIPTDKKVLVFNHRWAKSTGFNRMMEYMEGLEDEYKIWCTDYNAPKPYVGESTKLNSGQYRYLLENTEASICFVDNYATWNLAIQDGMRLGKPVLIYEQSNIKKIVGDNYPYLFKTKEEFQEKLRLISKENKDFSWKLPDFNSIFKGNLVNRMEELITAERKHTPKDGYNWLYCVMNGYKTKAEITEQVQPNMGLNGVWQYIRRWMIYKGVKDNIESPYPSYFIPEGFDQELLDKVKSEVDLQFKPTQRKKAEIVSKHDFF